jgi:hypothetical protein
VENDDYAAFTGRVIRAQGRRIAAGDVEGLTELLALEDELARAVSTAVTGLRGCGYSWAEIAARTGTTRQAAHQRWGRHCEHARVACTCAVASSCRQYSAASPHALAAAAALPAILAYWGEDSGTPRDWAEVAS